MTSDPVDGVDPRDPVEPTHPWWPYVAGGAGIVLFVGWLVAYVVALVAIPTGCAVETGFEVGYELVDQLLGAWTGLLLLLGVGYVATAFGAFVTRRLDPRSGGTLLAVGLLLVVGTILMSWFIADLVMNGQLSRTYTSCDV